MLSYVGSLKDYYLFHHRRISKRSLRYNNEHHSALNSEPEVRWLQQLHEKIRRKRDGPFSALPGYAPYDVIRSSTGFGVSLTSPRLAYTPSAVFHPLVPRAPRIQYRDAGTRSIFPDPLFKEQWYLGKFLQQKKNYENICGFSFDLIIKEREGKYDHKSLF
uniref:S8_pro-domain domain-containing protein n=1 Tax=Glossina brevipalpis TaxID=37001 RepID=A0A1A9W1G2_9MUSC